MEWLGFKSVHNMVNQAKIPYQTRPLVRIAQKYEGLKQIEIMRTFTLSPSTVYRILNGEKKEGKLFKSSRKGEGPVVQESWANVMNKSFCDASPICGRKMAILL